MLENTVHLAIATLRYVLEGETDLTTIAGLTACIRQLEIILEIGPISDNELQGGLSALEASFSEGGEAGE